MSQAQTCPNSQLWGNMLHIWIKSMHVIDVNKTFTLINSNVFKLK
jgi:hypothetical protein